MSEVNVCPFCGKQINEGHFCRKCGLCKNACKGSCAEMPSVYRGIQWGAGVVNTLSRPLGLEVEIGSWGTVRNISARWFSYIVERDGSVAPSGQEMVVQPLHGDEVVKGICDLWRVLGTGRAQMNETCGLHVHVGALDFDEGDLRRLLRLYVGLEAEIYGMLIEPNRRSGGCVRYARMLSDTDKKYARMIWDAEGIEQIREAFYRFLYRTNGDNKEQIKEYRANKVIDGYHGTLVGIRYLGLNLHSWMHRGTIEWRMKEGTTSLEELLFWPLWCGWFVEIGMQLKDEEVERVRKLGLVGFTKEFMPGMIGEWVEKKARIKETRD